MTGVSLLQIPALTYGWMSLFSEHAGNALLQPIIDGSRSGSFPIRLCVPLFFSFLIPAIPFLAKKEEEIFRKGKDEWCGIIWSSVIFGLSHCIMGIPLGAGFALIIPGLFFGYKYKRAFDNSTSLTKSRAEDEAVMESTVYHTMHNTIALGIVLGFVIKDL